MLVAVASGGAAVMSAFVGVFVTPDNQLDSGFGFAQDLARGAMALGIAGLVVGALSARRGTAWLLGAIVLSGCGLLAGAAELLLDTTLPYGR